MSSESTPSALDSILSVVAAQIAAAVADGRVPVGAHIHLDTEPGAARWVGWSGGEVVTRGRAG